MKIFVTGASGFIGAHIVRHLLDRGHEIICLVRPSSRIDQLPQTHVQFKRGDLRDLQSLRDAMKGCRAAYHCAADYRLWCKDPREMYASNVDGTRNTMQAAIDEGVERVVYTSTVGCLGLGSNGTPADESVPVSFDQMVGHYKRSKFLAEREVETWVQRGLPAVIVNPTAPVGDFDIKPTPTGKMVVDFLKRKMFGYVETGMNLVDVSDVAEGHILAAEKGKIGEKYILGYQNLTLKEIFDLLSSFTGIPSPRTRVPHWIAEGYAYGENFVSNKILGREPDVPVEAVKLSRHNMFFSAAKAVRELGLPQNSVKAALERAVNWFRENGYA